MSLLTKISDLFGKSEAKALPSDLKGTGGWEVLANFFNSGQWVSSSSIFQNLSIRDKEEAYRHPIVFACVREITDTLIVPSLEIGTWLNEDEWKPAPNHPMMAVLTRPNEMMNQKTFLKHLAKRLQLTGAGYFEKIRAKSGRQIVQLWPYPSSWVQPIPSNSGEHIFSGYRIINRTDIVPIEDMGALRYWDPMANDKVISPLDACWRDYFVDNERTNFQAEMLKNLKIPGVAIEVEDELSPDARERLREDFENRFGVGNRGRPIVLEGNGKISILNPLGDFDWPGITSLSETRICAAFGVPPILVHLRAGLDRATYSNYEQAVESFHTETMASIWTDIADDLTHHLLRVEGEMNLEFRFRYDSLKAFTEDRSMRIKDQIALKNASIITANEARDYLDITGEIESPAQPAQLIQPAEPVEDENDDEEDEGKTYVGMRNGKPVLMRGGNGNTR